MLTRIAIIAGPSNDLDRIRSAIRNPLKFTVREFLSMDAVVKGLVAFPMDVLLLRVNRFELRSVEMILKARRRFQTATILVLAKEIDPAARLKSAMIENFALLEEPNEVADLPLIIEKHGRGEASAHRQHPRARRGEEVQVIDAQGRVHKGRFLDFAQMGAKLSVPSLYRLSPRESVQIVYSSSTEGGKKHRIEAKVIWSSLTGGFVDQLMGVKQQTAGFRFIASY